MENRLKVIVVLIAYNAEKTLTKVLKKLPKGYFDDVILVDDKSRDNTFQKAKKLGIKSYQNPVNMGYGGNLKICLLKALEKGADVIVDVHPDNEYDPQAIIPALEKVKAGADLVLGNRFISWTSALSMGMPFWKYIPSRLLSFFHNFIFGVSISDWHQGFRVYTRRLLENVNFTTNSNSYLFSFEIILQAYSQNRKIDEVPVVCSYSGKKRGASTINSILYSLGTFKIIFFYFLSQFGVKNYRFSGKRSKLPCTICNKKYFVQEKYKTEDFVTGKPFSINFCYFCNNGFTYPVPRNLGKYYSNDYFGVNNTLGAIRRYAYALFQKRRIDDIISYKKSGKVLDLGAGEGHIGELLKKKGFIYFGLDAPFAELKNENIFTVDFLTFNSRVKYDVITFWESLEHMPQPEKYLEKASRLLNYKGVILIEVPRYNSLESFLFGHNWYHLSPPRHLSHFTTKGLKNLLEHKKYKVIKQKGVLALEYGVWGAIQSFFNCFQSQDKATAVLIGKNKIPSKVLYVFLAFLLLPLAIVFEIALYVLKSSPIMLYVAMKKE